MLTDDPPKSIQHRIKGSFNSGIWFLNLGVYFIAFVMLGGLIVSAVGFWTPKVNEFLLPRFGSIGLILSANSLWWLHCWHKDPTRANLITASFMTIMLGLLNAWLLIKVGTTDVAENIYLYRLHSSWIWSVGSYLTAGLYMALVALLYPRKAPKPKDPDQEIS